MGGCGWGLDIHNAIMTRQIFFRKYLHKYIDIYGYIHRCLHTYLNIMDVYIDITESSRRLAAAAPGLGPWATARSRQAAYRSTTDCRDGASYYATRKVTDKKGCQPNRCR